MRQKFMQLPGAPRSRLNAEGKGTSKNVQKKMVTDLHATFAANPEIEVEGFDSALYSKPGYEWHWTIMGFQLIEKGKDARSKFRLSP
ncbi:MAG: hypothetical protein ACRD8Z_18660, partial [Nitrososphaeraceae archaeon]